MELIAKPIVKNKYWVVTDGSKKVGNVVFDGSHFNVRIGDDINQYDDTNKISNIKFEKISQPRQVEMPPFAVYPTFNKTYNNVFDLKKKLHLFTKTAKSKCFYAAGWFVMNHNSTPEVVFCPKYIFVQRYDYMGPFKTKEEAKSMINNSV